MLTLSTERGPERGEALWADAWIWLIQGDRDYEQRRLAECRRIAEHFLAMRCSRPMGTSGTHSVKSSAAMWSTRSSSTRRLYCRSPQARGYSVGADGAVPARPGAGLRRPPRGGARHVQGGSLRERRAWRTRDARLCSCGRGPMPMGLGRTLRRTSVVDRGPGDSAGLPGRHLHRGCDRAAVLDGRLQREIRERPRSFSMPHRPCGTDSGRRSRRSDRSRPTPSRWRLACGASSARTGSRASSPGPPCREGDRACFGCSRHGARRAEGCKASRAKANVAVGGAWPPSAHDYGQAAGTELTDREAQVAALVAEGHGNEEIAVVLVVSAGRRPATSSGSSPSSGSPRARRSRRGSPVTCPEDERLFRDCPFRAVEAHFEGVPSDGVRSCVRRLRFASRWSMKRCASRVGRRV
jgi:hypothetical protein